MKGGSHLEKTQFRVQLVFWEPKIAVRDDMEGKRTERR
jgi:hypothetical protein